MVMATLLAGALALGMPWPVWSILALGAVRPWVGGVAVALLALVGRTRHRAGGRAAEAVYLAGIAAELRAGASLRASLEAAADRVPEMDLGVMVRRARSGADVTSVASALASQLPATGSLIVPATRMAWRSGGRAAAMFDRLALRAADEVAASRERRTATAQARLSAWVVGGLPLVALAFALASGRTEALLAGGPLGVGAMVAGLAMEAIGLAAVIVMSRETSP